MWPLTGAEAQLQPIRLLPRGSRAGPGIVARGVWRLAALGHGEKGVRVWTKAEMQNWRTLAARQGGKMTRPKHANAAEEMVAGKEPTHREHDPGGQRRLSGSENNVKGHQYNDSLVASCACLHVSRHLNCSLPKPRARDGDVQTDELLPSWSRPYNTWFRDAREWLWNLYEPSRDRDGSANRVWLSVRGVPEHPGCRVIFPGIVLDEAIHVL